MIKLFNRKLVSVMTFFLVILVVVQGCKKHDNYYYNYDEKLSNYDGTLYDYLVEKGDYDSLLYVIDRVHNLEDTLKTGELTLFAVQNKSFKLAIDALNLVRRTSSPARPDLSLATMDSAQLDTIVCRYILPGLLPAESGNLKDGLFAPTIRYSYQMNLKYERVNASGYVGGGPQRLFYGDTKTSNNVIPPVYFWVVAPTQIVNVKAKNGYIHVLSTGHDFGFGDEFVKRMNK